MTQQKRTISSVRTMWYVGGIIVLWTILIGTFITMYVVQQQQTLIELARHEATTSFGKDVVYQRWATRHGESNVAQQIKNPQDGIRVHIVSLKPFNPQNTPDQWEASALYEFKQGGRETYSIVMFDGKPYLRLMQPLITEKGCLNCHGAQGYRAGDIRGGISVLQPVENLMAVRNKNILLISLVLCLLWLLGLGGIGLTSRINNKNAAALKVSQEEIERLIKERSIASGEIEILRSLLPVCSSCQKIRDDEEYRKQINSYIREHAEAKLSDTICPHCKQQFNSKDHE